MAENKPILFGSGELFIVPESIDIDTATEQEIEEALVLVGESSGEAQLQVANEFKDVRGGAKNQLLASFMTNETVTFNAGIVTYNLKNLSEFTAGYYSETESKRVLGIGGVKTVPIKQLRFVHKKADGKRIMLDLFRAQNRNGLTFTFNAEEETTFDLEFTLLADASKQNGNIVRITEEI